MEKSEDTRDFKVNFTPEEIVNKDFKQKYRGYDSAEVDPFLDQVIQDYEAFNNRIKALEADNKRLVKKVDELSQQDTPTAAPVTTATPAPAANNAAQNTTNYDILRRLSNLERHVFGEQEAARIAPKPTAPSNSYSSTKTNSSMKSAYDDVKTDDDSDSASKKSTESTWLNRF